MINQDKFETCSRIIDGNKNRESLWTMPDHRDYRGVKLIISRSGLIAHTRRHLEMDVCP